VATKKFDNQKLRSNGKLTEKEIGQSKLQNNGKLTEKDNKNGKIKRINHQYASKCGVTRVGVGSWEGSINQCRLVSKKCSFFTLVSQIGFKLFFRFSQWFRKIGFNFFSSFFTLVSHIGFKQNFRFSHWFRTLVSKIFVLTLVSHICIKNFRFSL